MTDPMKELEQLFKDCTIHKEKRLRNFLEKIVPKEEIPDDLAGCKVLLNSWGLPLHIQNGISLNFPEICFSIWAPKDKIVLFSEDIINELKEQGLAGAKAGVKLRNVPFRGLL